MRYESACQDQLQLRLHSVLELQVGCRLSRKNSPQNLLFDKYLFPNCIAVEANAAQHSQGCCPSWCSPVDNLVKTSGTHGVSIIELRRCQKCQLDPPPPFLLSFVLDRPNSKRDADGRTPRLDVPKSTPPRIRGGREGWKDGTGSRTVGGGYRAMDQPQLVMRKQSGSKVAMGSFRRVGSSGI